MKKITFFSLVTFLLVFCSTTTVIGQSTPTDFNAGAAVIDMGISPQTEENGLIPYGLVVALVDAGIPVNWIIDDTKTFGGGDVLMKAGTDETDLIITGTRDSIPTSTAIVNYHLKAGPFLIAAEFMEEAGPIIHEWLGNYGDAVPATDTSKLTVYWNLAAITDAPVHGVITSIPNVLVHETDDFDKSDIYKGFYDRAGINTDNFSQGRLDVLGDTGLPNELGSCQQFYIMSHHSDPDVNFSQDDINTLYDFILNGGNMWLGCHDVSLTENVLRTANTAAFPAIGTHQLNFLSNSGLIPYKDLDTTTYTWLSAFDDDDGATDDQIDEHDNTFVNADIKYVGAAAGDPIMQFIGDIEPSLNGNSEHVYIPFMTTGLDPYDDNPTGDWRGTTTVGLYDSGPTDARAGGLSALVAYGPAYGNTDYGDILYTASHISGGGNEHEWVGEARLFGNFLFQSALTTAPEITVAALTPNPTVCSDTDLAVTAVLGTVPAGTQTYLWESAVVSGPGSNATFTPNATSLATTIDFPTVTDATVYKITFTLEITPGGCSNPITAKFIASVTVDAAPTTAAAGPDQAACETNTATLAGNTPTVGTGLWTKISGTGTITTPSSPTSGLTGLGYGDNVFRWTISNGVCTDSYDEVTITNDQQVTTADAGADQDKCDTTTFTLAGNTPTTGTGAWSVVSGPGTVTTPFSPTSGVTGVTAGNTLILRWTITNGECSDDDTVELTNDAQVTTAAAGADQDKCDTTTFTLAGNTPTTGTGAWSVVSGPGTVTTPSSPTSGVTGVTAGSTLVLRWTITNGECSDDDTVELTNDAEVTTAAAGPDQDKCDTTTFTLAGNTPTTGTGAWSVVSGPGAVTTPSSPTSGVTGVTAGSTLVLRWTITNGECSDSDDVELTNDAEVTTAAAGADQDKCDTTTFTLAGNTPTTGTGAWSVVSGPGTVTTPSSPTSGVTGVTAGSTLVLRWTITNGECSDSDDVELTNDAEVTTAAAGPDQDKCDTTTFTLAGNTPTTGTGAWSVVSGPGAVTTPSSPTSGVTGVTAGSTLVLRWTITNGECSDSDDVELTNDAEVTTAAAGADQDKCDTTTFTLAGNTPTTGTGAWSVVSGPGAVTTPSSPTSGVTGVTAGSTLVLRWTITNGECSDSDDVELTNDAQVTTAAAGADQDKCDTTTFTLAGNTPTTGTGAWSVVSGPGTVTTPSSPTSGVTGVTAGSTLVLRWTITNGECSDSDDVELTNDAEVTTADAGADQDKCDTTTFTLAGNTPTTGTGAWSVVSGPGTVTTPSSPTSGVTGVTAGNTLILRWTITNGECSDDDTVELTNDAEVTTAAAGADQDKCDTTTFTLAGNTPTTGTGAWSVVSGPGTVTTPSSPTSGVTGVTAGSTLVLRWTITNGECSDSDDVELTNDAEVTTAAAGPDQDKCDTTTFTLAGNTPTTGTGAWSVVSGPGAVTTPSSPTSGVTGVTAGSTLVLRWTITNGECSDSDDVELTNDAEVTTAAAGPDQDKCDTTTFTLAGNTPTTGTGAWSVVSGPGTVTTPSSPTSGVTGVTAGSTLVLRWTITNGECSDSDDVELTNDTLPAAPTASNQTVCTDGTDDQTLTATATPPAGSSIVWYTTSDGFVVASPVTQVGVGTSTYYAASKDNTTDCESATRTPVILTINDGPSPPTSGGDQTVCSNGSPGQTLTATATGGTITWYDAATDGNVVGSPTQVGVGTSTYYAQSDDGQCSSTERTAVTLTINPTPTASFNKTNVLCFGNNTGAINVSVSGGTAPYTYAWSNGASTQDLNNIAAGVYSVTVTDSLGCSDTLNGISISQPSNPISMVITKENATTAQGCEDGEATTSPSGGTAPYTYLWSASAGSQTTATATNLPSGTHTVTVTDANGCILQQGVVIDCSNTCDAIVAVDAVTDVLCTGDMTGSTTVSASSIANPEATFTFTWNTVPAQVDSGVTTSTLDELAAGVYTVSVTIDGTVCLAVEQSITITEPADALNPTASSTDESGPATGDGTATVNVLGGTGPYTYLWSPGGATTQTITGLSAGDYTVVVTDANGCTAEATTTVNAGTCLELAVSVATTSVTCNGDSDGTATATATGGSGSFTYLWSNDATTASIEGLSGGSYTIVVTDTVTLCTVTSTVTINEPNELSSGIAVTNILCNGNATGSLDLTISGGTAPYSFVWSNGATTEDLFNLTAGTYSVTVTDVYGCELSNSATVVEPTMLTATLESIANVTCFGDGDGTATVVANGGLSPYTYLWSDGQTTEVASELDIGTYSVTVTDANGCEVVSETITISEPDLVTADAGDDKIIDCNNLTVELNGSSTTDGASYAWTTTNGHIVSGADTATPIVNAAGDYVLTVTGATDCTETDSVTVTDNISIVDVEVTGNEELSCAVSSIILDASGTTVQGTASYLWSTGATTSTIIVDTPGEYSVTVIDSANGCAGSSGNIIVTEDATPLEWDGGTLNICIIELPSDLTLLLGDYVAGGTWTDNFNTGTLTGSMFDPGEVELDPPNITSLDFEFTYTEPGDCGRIITVYVIAHDDCIVYPCESPDGIEISKVVTANSDGYNDVFEISDLEPCDFTADVQIFNRWGKIVYQSSNYQNDWDGYDNGGALTIGSSTKLPTGTYYYVITIVGSGYDPMTGYIYLATH